ncbi:lysophospholipid acyltransferase family protein [Aeromicrobium sp. CF3.5]|uniref:lysophospholipid acyltransferase family protein n=1 Tax=Aeromicrobium sp. CF3.5 TaxID=3373078 RepID=UPI003EE555D4
MPANRPRPAGRNGIYRFAVATFGVLFASMGYRFDVRGAEHLPAEGPGVLAGNHIGFLDFTFVGYAARERGRLVRFASKASVFEIPVVGWLMRAMRHIPVERRSGARAYRRCLDLVDEGELVGLFPEATISRSWRLKPFKRGAAGIAVNRRVPLIPVIVWGGHRVLTVDGRRSLRRRIPITIMVGPPLEAGPHETVDALNVRLRAAMDVLLDDAIDTYPDAPRSDDDRWWLPHDRGGTAPDVATAAELDRAAVARIGDIFE